MTRRWTLALAAALVAGCTTDTREAGPDALDAAARRGWTVDGATVRPGGPPGHVQSSGAGKGPADAPDEIFDAPAPNPEDVVEVPLEAYAPIDSFLDHEGYLLGDRIEIDCSMDPFKARLGAMAAANEQAKFVVREEKREGDVHTVHLGNIADGPSYQPDLLPRATFGSLHGFRATDAEGRPVGDANLRPFFEFVGTREIIIRFHASPSRDCPVFFHARAVGTPSLLRPGVVKECVYLNANRGRKVRGVELSLDLEIRRPAGGRWEPVIRDPGTPAGEAGGR